MKNINKELKLGECQEHRIWIHSNTLGYGKWVSTIRLVSIIKRLSTSHNPDYDSEKEKPSLHPKGEICHHCKKGEMLEREDYYACSNCEYFTDKGKLSRNQ